MYSNINRELAFKYDAVLRKNMARYYWMMLDSKQYREHSFRRSLIALKYINLAQPDWLRTKDILKEYVIPAPLLKIYSTLRLMPYRQTSN